MRTLGDSEKKTDLEIGYYDINVNELLTQNKKLIAFLGAGRSGNSFIVNNLARMLCVEGVNVAILDATRNKSAYYIYTKNEQTLRMTAKESIENLSHGEAKGVVVNDRLTVYTGLPGETEGLQKVEQVLGTLLNHHTVVLMDCDFDTPDGYFSYAQMIYIVQSMDVLSIQPLTEKLAKLKETNTFDGDKVKIIINKYMQLRTLSEKEIIGGLAFYNDPTMSYMKQLFDKTRVEYLVIPFEKEIYAKYLEGVANCNIDVSTYPDSFISVLEQLKENIYPLK